MTRRSLLLGGFLPVLGGAVPAQDDDIPGFIVSGRLESENEPGLYSLNGAESVTLMLSPELTPNLARIADRLVGKRVEIALRSRF